MSTGLFIERSTSRGSWALHDGEKFLFCGDFSVSGLHSPLWFSEVTSSLTAVGILPSELDAIVVGVGPGSFSGIRAVIAAMSALVLPSGKSILGLSSAAALAWGVARREGASEVTVMGDARRGQFWLCDYVIRGNELSLADGRPPKHSAEDFQLLSTADLEATVACRRFVVSSDYSRLARNFPERCAKCVLQRDEFATARDLAELYHANPEAAVCGALPVYLHPPVV